MNEVRGGGWPGEATLARGQGQRSGGPTPGLRPEAAARRSCLQPEARGNSQEGHPQVQGAVAARAPEGLEELFHIQGQEGWL